MPGPDEFLVDFPTTGFLVADWIEAHCIVPDRHLKGQPFTMYRPQLWWTVNHYRVRPNATGEPEELNQAFHYRRSQIVGPQKCGKGPWSASITCNEGVGPALFDGFARRNRGDRFDCADHGCGCGWRYVYDHDEPMGRPWANPLLQLLATSDDQVDNVYRPLQAMARAFPLKSVMRVGEDFIRLPDEGKIETVTASAQSRLGNPIRFCLQDESGLYTRRNGLVRVAQTMRRGAAGMGGRSIETTNPWDPAENSTAQQTAESRRPDIFRFHRLPPSGLSYRNKDERRRIHRYVYDGFDHVNLDSIEAEAAELIETDPEQAERFYGNRLVQGAGTWLPDGLWEKAYAGAVATRT